MCPSKEYNETSRGFESQGFNLSNIYFISFANTVFQQYHVKLNCVVSPTTRNKVISTE